MVVNPYTVVAQLLAINGDFEYVIDVRFVLRELATKLSSQLKSIAPILSLSACAFTCSGFVYVSVCRS